MASAAWLPASILGRILVVDDNSVNREVLRATLQPAGFSVTLACSVREGLNLAGRAVFDLILSDLHMPREDGFSFLLAARSHPRLQAISFVIITSSVWGERDREKALALGALDFIQRPIEPRCLLERVAGYFQSAAPSAVGGRASVR